MGEKYGERTEVKIIGMALYWRGAWPEATSK